MRSLHDTHIPVVTVSFCQAYMAVTNLVKDQETDHVARIARFASGAIVAANDTLIDEDDPDKGCVNIRVGT